MMTEIPLSAVAWVSVVLIQAVIHFFVLGHLRNRRDACTDTPLTLEESLSLAETLSLSDADTNSVALSVASSSQDINHQIPLSPVTNKSQHSLGEGDINILLLGKTLVSERVLDGNTENSQDFIDFLSHTGTELLKVSYYRTNRL